MKKIIGMAALLAAAFNPAWAHPDHDDVPPAKAPKLELTSTKDGAVVYVTSGGEKMSTIGAKGTLTVVSKKASQDVVLAPVGVNGLEAKAPFKIAKGSKAKVSVTLADSTVIVDELTAK